VTGANWRAHYDKTASTVAEARVGGPGVGRWLRFRHPHPLRQRLFAAQGVHRSDRAALDGGQARRQSGDLVHLRHQSPRRPGVHSARAQQHLLPLGSGHRRTRIHRPTRLRRGRCGAWHRSPDGWPSCVPSAKRRSRPGNDRDDHPGAIRHPRPTDPMRALPPESTGPRPARSHMANPLRERPW